MVMIRRSPSSGTSCRADATGRPSLSVNAALDLGVCGTLAAGLTVLGANLYPGFPAWATVLVPTGGALCVLWTILGRWGRLRRSVVIASMTTLAVMAIVCGVMATRVWQAGGSGDSRARLCAILMCVVVVCCTGVLLNLLRGARRR